MDSNFHLISNKIIDGLNFYLSSVIRAARSDEVLKDIMTSYASEVSKKVPYWSNPVSTPVLVPELYPVIRPGGICPLSSTL